MLSELMRAKFYMYNLFAMFLIDLPFSLELEVLFKLNGSN